jgi:methylthioribose-1-phosphate isomerase
VTAEPIGPDRQPGEELAVYCAQLYRRGWMPGTAGNLSLRLPGDDERALITASGRDKGEMSARDMVEIDAGTGAAHGEGTLRASAEVSIHAAIYRSAPAGAVIHVHSPYATAVATRASADGTVAQVAVERFELLKGLGLADPSRTQLPVFPNWPDVPRIARDIETHLRTTAGAPPGVLIADHGITTWGADLAQARNRLECLEAICHLLLLTGAGPRPEPIV